MIREALEYLTDAFTAAAEPHVLIEDETRKHVLLRSGDVKPLTKLPQRSSAVEALSTFTHFDDETAEVWYSGKQVVLVQDPGFCMKQHEMLLKASPVHEAITAGWKSHKHFVRMLRSTCYREIEAASPGLFNTLKDMRFSSAVETASNVGNTKESLGRSIQNEATGAGEIPEQLTLSVRRWVEFDISETVDVFIDIDFDNARLRFVPLVSSYQEAETAWFESLHDLVEAACPQSTVCRGLYDSMREVRD